MAAAADGDAERQNDARTCTLTAAILADLPLTAGVHP